MFGFRYLSLNIRLPLVLGKAKSPLWGQTPALGAARRGHSKEGSPLPSASSWGWQGVGGRGSARFALPAAKSRGRLRAPGLKMPSQHSSDAGSARVPAVPGPARLSPAVPGRVALPAGAQCHRASLRGAVAAAPWRHLAGTAGNGAGSREKSWRCHLPLNPG